MQCLQKCERQGFDKSWTEIATRHWLETISLGDCVPGVLSVFDLAEEYSLPFALYFVCNCFHSLLCKFSCLKCFILKFETFYFQWFVSDVNSSFIFLRLYSKVLVTFQEAVVLTVLSLLPFVCDIDHHSKSKTQPVNTRNTTAWFVSRHRIWSWVRISSSANFLLFNMTTACLHFPISRRGHD